MNMAEFPKKWLIAAFQFNLVLYPFDHPTNKKNKGYQEFIFMTIDILPNLIAYAFF